MERVAFREDLRDGEATDLAFSDDVAARFLAYGWNVQPVGDANDRERLTQAIEAFRRTIDVPISGHDGKFWAEGQNGEPLVAESVDSEIDMMRSCASANVSQTATRLSRSRSDIVWCMVAPKTSPPLFNRRRRTAGTRSDNRVRATE